jgi:hypothetical protein
MTRFRFTLRELLFTVAALAAYLAMTRHFLLASIKFFEKHKPMGWLVTAESFVLMYSPLVAILWLMGKLQQSRKPKVSALPPAEESFPPSETS